MIKTAGLAPGTCRDDISDFHPCIGDHYTVDEALNQGPWLREGRVRQSLTDTLTNAFDRGDQGRSIRLSIDTGLQWLHLGLQYLQPLLQVLPLTPIRWQGDHVGQIGFGQAVQ
jgi:hypothetical protein